MLQEVAEHFSTQFCFGRLGLRLAVLVNMLVVSKVSVVTFLGLLNVGLFSSVALRKMWRSLAANLRCVAVHFISSCHLYPRGER
ncbi:hypothetical protein HR12_39195 [Microbacterium sp. SUBG005]|nr:hypothetical protein HR12_39195 [Microbacterium sp. SUBG005]